MSNCIALDNVKIRFGDLLVLSDLSFSVENGETVALIGPSGCGKSTLLRVIAGIIPHMISAEVSGDISTAGTMDMMFQESNLLPWRTVKSNVELGLELLDRKVSSDQVMRLLQDVGLKGFENSYPFQLSGGMKQRASLVSTLITSPDILLMDEPFGSLDALTREDMWEVLGKMCQQQDKPPAMILVTHSIDEAVVLADRILIMGVRPGRIVSELSIRIDKPRHKDGMLLDECLELTNKIRMSIREANA